MHSKVEKTAYESFLQAHQDKVYRICQAYAYFPELSKDLYQEVLLNLWSSWNSFEGKAKLTTWMYRVTVNTAITFNKKEKKFRVQMGNAITHEVAEDANEKQEKIQTENALDKMHIIISQLPKEERVMIGLYLEDVSYKEMADILGSTTNFIGVKLNRIKKKLASQMG